MCISIENCSHQTSSTTILLTMSDEEISRDPETRGPEARSSTDSSFSPKNALALFSQQLYSALGKHKQTFRWDWCKKWFAECRWGQSFYFYALKKNKFEGNARQYDFNASRLDEVSRAKELFDRGSTCNCMDIIFMTYGKFEVTII